MNLSTKVNLLSKSQIFSAKIKLSQQILKSLKLLVLPVKFETSAMNLCKGPLNGHFVRRKPLEASAVDSGKEAGSRAAENPSSGDFPENRTH